MSFAKPPDRACSKSESKEAQCSNKRGNKICIFSGNKPRCVDNTGQELAVREKERRKGEKQARKNNEKKRKENVGERKKKENVEDGRPKKNNKKKVKLTHKVKSSSEYE